jgi:hypothetical protein
MSADGNTRFRKTLLRVMAVQIIALAILGLIQWRYTP